MGARSNPETGVVLDRDARDVGELLASQARHTATTGRQSRGDRLLLRHAPDRGRGRGHRSGRRGRGHRPRRTPSAGRGTTADGLTTRTAPPPVAPGAPRPRGDGPENAHAPSALRLLPARAGVVGCAFFETPRPPLRAERPIARRPVAHARSTRSLYVQAGSKIRTIHGPASRRSRNQQPSVLVSPIVPAVPPADDEPAGRLLPYPWQSLSVPTGAPQRDWPLPRSSRNAAQFWGEFGEYERSGEPVGRIDYPTGHRPERTRKKDQRRSDT
jgi:hypothetical protein